MKLIFMTENDNKEYGGVVYKDDFINELSLNQGKDITLYLGTPYGKMRSFDTIDYSDFPSLNIDCQCK